MPNYKYHLHKYKKSLLLIEVDISLSCKMVVRKTGFVMRKTLQNLLNTLNGVRREIFSRKIFQFSLFKD